MPIRSPIVVLFFKNIYIAFICYLFYIETVFLGLSQEQMIVALIGSLCGSLTLNYFRKSVSLIERILKVLMSAIGGVFIGTALTTYFRIEAIQYIGSVYFLTSFVILIFLRSILSLTEKNASGIVTTIFQRVFRIDNDGVQKETKIITAGATSSEMQKVHKEAVKHEVIAETTATVEDLTK